MDLCTLFETHAPHTHVFVCARMRACVFLVGDIRRWTASQLLMVNTNVIRLGKGTTYTSWEFEYKYTIYTNHNYELMASVRKVRLSLWCIIACIRV